MRIAAISGSPRKNGNSEMIIDKAISYFKDKNVEIGIIKLSEISIKPCSHCDYCKSNDSCSEDEKANEVNELLEKADAIIVVSPVYFGGMTGQLKCMLDKTLPLRRAGFKLKGKIGAGIAVGGSRNGGQELTLKDIHAWMLVHGMVVVGDNNHFGGTAHNPQENDEVGEKTEIGTFEAVADLLVRLDKNG